MFESKKMRFAVALSLLPMIAAPSFASDFAQAPHLEARLVSEQRALSPGASFEAGIHFRLEKGWHIYWQNAGDSGDPPRLRWKLPDGVHAGDILWPVPKRIQVGPLVNYGYEEEVLLPVPIQIGRQLRGSVPLQVHVGWLVCREECIPGEATLSLEIPIRGDERDPRWAGLFDAARAMLPLPAPSDWRAEGALLPDSIELSVRGVPPWVREAWFFPSTGDAIENAVAPVVTQHGSTLELRLKRSDRLVESIKHLPGLLLLTTASGGSIAYQFDVPMSEGPASSVYFSLLAAFLGGLLLNLMPCVFPVLSIKVLSLVRMSGQERAEMRRSSWAYTLGILVSFWLLVGALVALRAGGQRLGWGFQLQSPRFVLIMACVLFALGLNLVGVFELGGGRVTGVGDRLASREGFAGSFFTGALATLVATPCSAPFMGSAIGFALTRSPTVIFAVFTWLALGLASPFVVIAHVPWLSRCLPKPGVWMETLKQLMAFPLFGTLVWLAWVLARQTALGPVALVGACVMTGFAAWLAGRWPRQAWVALGVALLSIGAATAFLGPAPTPGEPGAAASAEGLHWLPFSPESLAEHRARGEPVFIDFTAAWCITCQVSELLVFRSPEVRAKLKELGVTLLKADWTNQDPVITQMLAAFGRDGVPFYVIYGKGKNAPAVPLPEVINAGIVLNELEKIR